MLRVIVDDKVRQPLVRETRQVLAWYKARHPVKGTLVVRVRKAHWVGPEQSLGVYWEVPDRAGTIEVAGELRDEYPLDLLATVLFHELAHYERRGRRNHEGAVHKRALELHRRYLVDNGFAPKLVKLCPNAS